MVRMEHITNSNLATPPAEAPRDPELAAGVSACVEETFTPESRKARHDGWTPERIGDFLFGLASCGTVEGAAAAAGLSPQSAYNFRNRRQGRAFAKMWDAVLIHRGRAKVAGDNQARAVAGNVSRRMREGVVVEELHFHDNRLSMAVLTRLDRLAEKEAPNEDHLRALSEELEEFVECIEAGGDADAFVEERRPEREQAQPEAEPKAASAPGADTDEFDRLAGLVGCSDWRDVEPLDIPVDDLDLAQQAQWTADQWVRAGRSGFLIWVECGEDAGPELAPETLAFVCDRALTRAQARQEELEESLRVEVGDLHPGGMPGWSEEQWVRAERSGLLGDLPDYVWRQLRGGEAREEREEAPDPPSEASTSSTFPVPRPGIPTGSMPARDERAVDGADPSHLDPPAHLEPPAHPERPAHLEPASSEAETHRRETSEAETRRRETPDDESGEPEAPSEPPGARIRTL